MKSINQFAQICKIVTVLLVILFSNFRVGNSTSDREQVLAMSESPQQRQQMAECFSATPGKTAECEQAQTAEIQSAQSVSGTPLSFSVNDDTSTAMYYNGVQQFYGRYAEGVFIWVNGMVYGPGQVPAGQTTNAYTWVSNSLSGTGTSGDPWKATTIVNVGNTGLRLQQEIKYVNGDSYVTYSWRVSNATSNTISYTLFHAADLYTQNSDFGYGYYGASTGAIGGYNSSHSFYQYFHPITSGSHYFEGYYSDTWQRIGSISGQGAGFNDSYRPNDYIDNSAGLQWNRTLAANGVDLISDYGVFNTQIGGITCYSLSLSYDSSKGSITRTPVDNCPSGSGYTYNTPVVLKANPASGYKFTRWGGDVSGTSTITNVVITRNKTVTANFDLIRQSILPPVVLVHGWHGKWLPGETTDTCGSATVAYHITDPDNQLQSINDFYDFGVFAKNLILDHRDVWVAHIATGPGGTPRLGENATCLERQLMDIRAQTGAEKVVLIAHSMGGLVSRAYLESKDVRDVAQLITLGSPHTGTTYMYHFCVVHPFDFASCEMTPIGMLFFNASHYKNESVTYNLIGGNLTPGILGLNLFNLDGENDGVVGVNSGMGLDYPMPFEAVQGSGLTRFAIGASHSSIKIGPITDLLWFPSFFNKLSGLTIDQITPTDTYKCIRQLLGIAGGTCPSAVTALNEVHSNALVVSNNIQSNVVFGFRSTPTISGHLTAGQVITIPVPIDTNIQSNFDLTWTAGDLSLTLKNPNGITIDPAYAATHSDEVVYTENTDPSSLLFANYAFNTTVLGQYILTVSTNNVGSEGTDFSLSVQVDSPRTLSIVTDQTLYPTGGIATLTAAIENAGVGLTGATVQALISKPGVVNDTVTLTDQGGGVYQGTYALPNAPGYFSLSVIANGTDSGIEYARQVDNLLVVSPPTVQLTGTYSDSLIDNDSNGKYEALAMNVDLDVAQAGDYLVSGDLVSGNSLVAHYLGSHTFVSTGINTATMLFNGDDIRQSTIDGPYTLTNLTIADEQNGDLPAIWQAANVWTTGVYNYQDFAATCFVLNLTTNLPASGTIIRNPAPNCNGGLQYTSGSEVTLTASSSPGYSFSAWSGDLSGSGGTVSIIVNADKSVTANFSAATTNTEIYIGITKQASYYVPTHASLRQSFAGINNGPVKVNSTNGNKFVASERVAYSPDGGTTWTSHSELMGLPANLVHTSYTFPFYNNFDLNSQLRFGNVGTLPTTVTVIVGGQPKGSYTLAPNASQRVSYAGLNAGPVVIRSNGQPIIASLRVAYTPDAGATWTSFSEMMGLPSNKLTNSYIFPWYNNLTLNSQLRFGNVGTAPTNVTVAIAGQVYGPYTLQPNESKRVSYPGLDKGPVKITSSGNVPIIASMRVAYHNGTAWTDFSEMMGLPASSLSTHYSFPIYNNVDLNTQLRFGNVGNINTTVTVTINGVVRGTYNLAPNQSQRVGYSGVNSGPVVIQSSGGVPIIASERVAYFNGSAWTSFAEMMGLPQAQLWTSYIFPWYNNVDLNTQLRFGVP